MKKLTFLAIMLLILVASCKKKQQDPEPDLPPETQHGADTFGCYLNGVPWKPSPKSFGNNTLYIQLDGPYFVLYALYDGNGRRERIDFFSKKINSLREGEYSINKNLNSDNSIGFWDIKRNIDLLSGYQDVIDEGLITITKFDTQRKFVSGRFWFTLQKDSIKYEATEGRFDISY